MMNGSPNAPPVLVVIIFALKSWRIFTLATHAPRAGGSVANRKNKYHAKSSNNQNPST